jgi:hypothetical protein
VPPVEMMPTAYKHGFEFEEALWVMAHPVGRELVATGTGHTTVAYVGFPHEGSDRRVELLAEHIPPRTIRVFHFSDLTDHWSHLWKESGDES